MRNGQNMDYVLISRCVVYLFVVAAHCRGQLIPLSQQSFKDITSNVFETQVEGVVAAFGDFDCDKKTDIFVIAEDGHRVDLWLWHEKSSTAPGSTPGTLRKCQNATIKIPNEVITSVVPGDYDGDSRMDLLVLTKPLTKAKDDTAPTSSHIYWGITKQLAFDLKNTTVSVDMFDQPLVMDYNADMVPDIFGADSNGDRFFWSADPNSKHNRNIVPKPFSDETETAQETLLPLRKPHSHIFVDLSGDLGADLLVTSVDSGVTKFEQWIKTNDKLQWDGTYIDLPSGNFAHVGQSVYTDIDASGKVDHLLPVCEDELCHNSAIYAMYDDETEWRLLLNGFTFGSMGWGFIPPADNPLTISNIPIMLNIGDYTMDGFPDALAILQNTSHG
uniref:T-cell immunomodulatory protein-like n=1 Tax=Saccoglossus kowalevskii TaxID=10224 RepID=A0ABM0M0W4_SACKO|nr:PREDICTED: T-cell immunomodulatory protein-like [Saccoglossus kowalevskii]